MQKKRGKQQPYSIVLGRSRPIPMAGLINVYSITRDLLSSNEEIRQSASWDLLSLAKRGKNVLSQNLSPAMRLCSDLVSRNNLTSAILHSAKQGHDIDDCLGALCEGYKSGDFTIRNNCILAIAYHAENGRDIYIMLGILAEALEDESPQNREAAVRALKAFASQGTEQAHQVFLNLKNADDVWVFDVRIHCMKILRG